MRRTQLKGQDLLLALRLVRAPGGAMGSMVGEQWRVAEPAVPMAPGRPADWRITDLAQSIGVSGSEVHASWKRLMLAQLAGPKRYEVRTAPLLEFLEHGVRYAFPVAPGAEVSGVPTALSLPSVKAKLEIQPGPSHVWPLPESERFWSGQHRPLAESSVQRGMSVPPLYPSVPLAAANDPWLHHVLALVDCICLGRAREREGAARALRDELTGE
jgi:hypothetical protein